MKKLYILLFAFLALSLNSEAQNGVKKYILLEHFTNTNCSICASRNNTFFNLIDNYPKDVHHIAYHPPFPYIQCIFYQFNTAGNMARTDYYNILGTPEVLMWGKEPTPPGGLIVQEALENGLGQTSPLEVIVVEEGNVFRTVKIEVKTWGDIPAGNYKLHVMVAEQNILYNAPNGETEHHNVYRESLQSNGGISFTPAPVGESVNFEYGFPIDFEWFEEETYVLAFVQNDDTKDIINSGTKFDERNTTSLTTLANTKSLRLSPNPVQDQLFVDFGQAINSTASLKIYDTQGKLLMVQQVAEGIQQTQVNVAGLPEGVLLVQLENEEGLWSGKLIK